MTGANDRLAYIAGLRGLAALEVAMGHILGMVPPDHPTFSFLGADTYHRIIWPWLFGGQAVWLFLMVSGFALYWSEARRRDAGKSATPLNVYVKRRLWRILPTYYAAVALGLAVLLLGASIYLAPSQSLDTARPVTWGGFLSHIVFVHNLNADWFSQISPPLWSIAVEMQLYLLFPLVVMRRWRSPIIPAVGLVVAVRLVQQAVGLPVFSLVEFFMAGVVLAYIARNWRPLPPRLLSAAAAALLLLGLLRLPQLSHGMALQVVWLAAFAALLLRLHVASEGRRNVTTWRPVLTLGEASYSLYAMHFPAALAIWWGVGRLGLGHFAEAMVMILVGLPAALLLTWACHRWVERPSMARVRAAGRDRPLSAEVLNA